MIKITEADNGVLTNLETTRRQVLLLRRELERENLFSKTLSQKFAVADNALTAIIRELKNRLR